MSLKIWLLAFALILIAATAASGSTLTSAQYKDGEMRVYYLTGDKHVHELASWSDHSWHDRDVTSDSQAMLASGIALTSAQYKDGEMRVYYLTGDGRVHELASWSDHSWHHRDVASDSQAPPSVSRRILTSAQYKDGEMRVYYLTSDGHIHELASWSDHSWHDRDVTSDSQAPVAAYDSALTSTQYKDGEMRVYYLTSNGHVHELASWSDHSWHHRDVTSDSQASVAASGSPLASTQYKDGEMRVYYLTSNGHVHELASWSDHSWHHRDVTSDSQAPVAASGSPLAGALASTQYKDGEMRVYYLTSNGHVHELASWSDHSWHHRDVTSDSQAPAAGSI